MSRCARCGKSGEFSPLCPQCYLHEHPLLESFKPVEAERCALCHRGRVSAKWHPDSLDEQFSRIITHVSRRGREVTNLKLAVQLHLPEHREHEGVIVSGEAEIHATGNVPGMSAALSDEYRIPVTLRYLRCSQCRKKNERYYEAVLQLRHASEEAQRWTEQRLASEGVHISQREYVPEGIDYYLSSARFLRTLSREQRDRFGAEVTLTAKLFSQDKLTSRKLFRTVALVKMPPYHAGCVVFCEGKVIYLTSVSGEKLAGIDMSSGKRVSMRPRSKPELLERLETQVTKVHPRVEVLDPDTFESAAVEHSLGMRIAPGDRVCVAKREGRLYLVWDAHAA